MGEKQDNRSYYDEFSKSYEVGRHAGYHKMLDDLEDGYVKKFSTGKAVFEAGCGTGLVLGRASKYANRVFGADLSHGMLKQAREKGLPISQANVLQLPYPDNTFDVSCSFKVLAHVENIRGALAEIARVTKNGGVMLLEFYNPNSFRGWIKRMKKPTPIGDGTHDEHVYTRYDSLRDVRNYLPAGCEVFGVRGVRIVTPAAFFHKIPVVAPLLRMMEFALCDSPFHRLAGFQIFAIRVKK